MSETATLKVASRTLIVNGCYSGHVTTEERTSRLEGAYEQVNERLGEIRVELVGMNERFDTMDGSVNGRFDAMNGRFDTLNESINRRFDAQNRTMLAGIGLILAAVVGLSFV